MQARRAGKNPPRIARLGALLRRDKALILLALPGILFYGIFHYAPMYGVWMAFTNFNLSKSIIGSDFVGLMWFREFFSSYFFGRLVGNTLALSTLNLVIGFPVPILFALTLNEMRGSKFKRLVQTVSYLPHFISTVVVVGILFTTLSPTGGVVNTLIKSTGRNPINFMRMENWFRPLYIGTDIWQNFGWNSIIYLAALTAVDPGLYEAARIDGASRLRQVIHVSLPSILPTIIILLIMQMGRVMSVGYEKIILMYSPTVYGKADVISTYVYRRGIQKGEFSFGAAVGLFNNVINLILLITVNTAARKVSDISLW